MAFKAFSRIYCRWTVTIVRFGIVIWCCDIPATISPHHYFSFWCMDLIYLVKDRQWDTATRLRTMSHGVGVSKAMARDVKIAESTEEAFRRIGESSAKQSYQRQACPDHFSTHSSLSRFSLISFDIEKQMVLIPTLPSLKLQLGRSLHICKDDNPALPYDPHAFDHWSTSLPPCG